MDHDANFNPMYPFGPPPPLPVGGNPELMMPGFPFMPPPPPINGWGPPQPARKPLNHPGRGVGGRRYSLFYEKPPTPMPSGRRYSLRTEVRNHIEESGSGSSTVAIDNKIEQAMDLVKSHLMYAVREEVEVLKEQIKELMERLHKLEQENKVLRSEATPETLSKLPAPLPPIQNPLLQQLMTLHNPSSSTTSSS